MNKSDYERFWNEWFRPFSEPIATSWPTIKNGKRVWTTNVVDVGSEHVIWEIKDGKMVKVYDYQEKPF